jgi:hypothetical protein
MPKISEFNGIAIYMYYEDHNPPLFHAIYGGREAVIGIDPVAILAGSLSGKMNNKILAWARAHAAALMENWNRMQNGNEPNKI